MEYLQQSFTLLCSVPSVMILYTKGRKGKMAMKEVRGTESELPHCVSLNKMEFFADSKSKLAITFFSPNLLHNIGDK